VGSSVGAAVGVVSSILPIVPLLCPSSEVHPHIIAAESIAASATLLHFMVGIPLSPQSIKKSFAKIKTGRSA
jgi:hypothetical protein